MASAPRRGADDAETKKVETSRVARALKWVGGVTAVLSLVFAIVRAYELLSAGVERDRRVRERLQVARAQLDAHDYAAAWASAAAAAEVDADEEAVRRAQEDVAMAWIRNASVLRAADGRAIGGPGSFAELVAPLVPVLDRGALAATGARKADLLAHRGWADYLRARDGRAVADPSRSYGSALVADSANPYAHAMLGHWLLSSHADTRAQRAEALAHFAAAARSGRERPYVRRLQLAALENDHSDESEEETLRVANAMRLDGDTVDGGVRRRIHGTYWRRVSDPRRRAALLAALPADAHLATYRWLFDADLRDSTREASYRLHLGVVQARAGDTAAARATFRALRAARGSLRDGERAILDSALRGSR